MHLLICFHSNVQVTVQQSYYLILTLGITETCKLVVNGPYLVDADVY